MWEKRFEKRILNRGLEIYMRGEFCILEESEDTAYVQVKSESRRRLVYDVDFIFDMKKGTFEAYCDCPHAYDGNNCKHMAAAIYELKNNGLYPHEFDRASEGQNKQLAQESEPRLFGEDSTDYQYFSMPDIARNTHFTQNVITDAKSLVNKKQVTIEAVKTG